MEGNYEIVYNGESVGKAELLRQGLYYRIVCRCRISGGEIARLIVSWQDAWENLGIPVPEGDGLILRKKIPVKHIGDGDLRFQLIPISQKVEDILYPKAIPHLEIAEEQLPAEAPEKNHPMEAVLPQETADNAELNLPEQTSENKAEVPIREDAPFEPLDRLEEARLEIREGQAYALFPEAETPAQGDMLDVKLQADGTMV